MTSLPTFKDKDQLSLSYLDGPISARVTAAEESDTHLLQCPRADERYWCWWRQADLLSYCSPPRESTGGNQASKITSNLWNGCHLESSQACQNELLLCMSRIFMKWLKLGLARLLPWLSTMIWLFHWYTFWSLIIVHRKKVKKKKKDKFSPCTAAMVHDCSPD